MSERLGTAGVCSILWIGLSVQSSCRYMNVDDSCIFDRGL